MITYKYALMKEVIYFHRVSEEGQYFFYVLWRQVSGWVHEFVIFMYVSTSQLLYYLYILGELYKLALTNISFISYLC